MTWYGGLAAVAVFVLVGGIAWTRRHRWSNADFYGGCVGLLLLAVAGMGWLLSASERDREAACVRLYAQARTHADTMQIAIRCELGDEHQTTVVPMPIVIPTR